MRDENRRLPLVHHLAEDLDQIIYLLRRQHSRWLIQNQNVHVPIQQLQDLHSLLLAHRELPHICVRIHLQPVALSQGPQAALDPTELWLKSEVIEA